MISRSKSIFDCTRLNKMYFLLFVFVFVGDRIRLSNSEFHVNILPPISQDTLNASLVIQSDPIEFNINPKTLHKATINYGSLTYETKKKILNNECLNIVVIGGSVSCFQFAQRDARWHDDFPWFDPDGYAEKFENMLNQYLPCTRTAASTRFNKPRHVVANHCQAATPTDVFVQRFLESRTNGWDAAGFGADMKEVDLVVVETAMNDIHEGAENGKKELADPIVYLKKQTELLILLFQNISTHPSLIYLGASTRYRQLNLKNDPVFGCGLNKRSGDAVLIHSEITKYYDIPHVSVIDGVCPFFDDKARRWLEWYFNADTHGHPTKSGHTLIASFLLALFSQHILDLKFPPYGGNEEDPTDTLWQLSYVKPLPPLYSTPLEVQSYLLSHPLKLDLFKTEVRYLDLAQVSGFTVFEDVPKKPGFIATTVGSSFRLYVPGPDIVNHLKMGIVTFILMKSYENMGLLHVTCSVINTSTNEVVAVAEKTIDSLWDAKVSEQTVETLPFSLAAAHERKLDPKQYAVVLQANVIDASPSVRAENKVKLISVSFS